MPLLIDAVSLWSAFGTIVAKFLTDGLLRWIAWKTFVVVLVTVTLPIVLKNVIIWLFDSLMSFASTQISTDGLDAVAFEFTGFSGYLAYHLLIPESIAVILTGLAIRLILNFIPMVG